MKSLIQSPLKKLVCIVGMILILVNISFASPFLSSNIDSFNCDPTMKAIENTCKKFDFIVQNVPDIDSGFKYQWNFGDGNSSTKKNPTHTFQKFGNYNVCLTVFSPICTVTYCDTVRLQEPMHNISGVVFYDENKDGIYQPSEKILKNSLIQVFPGNKITATSAQYDTVLNGNYQFTVPAGVYIVTCPSLSNYEFSSPQGFDYHTVSIPNDTCSLSIRNIHFGVYPREEKLSPDFHFIAMNTNRPGSNVKYQISLKNIQASDIKGNIVVSLDPKLLFISSTPAPVSSSNNRLVYTVNGIRTFENFNINLQVLTPLNTNIGDTIVNTAQAMITQPNDTINLSKSIITEITRKTYGNEFLNNFSTKQQPISISVDSSIVYHLKFQNTKGTTSARRLVVIDTLDNNLDPSTLRFIHSSDETELSINNQVITWDFKNINLRDTLTQEESSHGFLIYSIQPKLTAKNGDTLVEKCHLLFDNNSEFISTQPIYYIINKPIMNVVNSSISTNELEIYPNPTSDVFWVKLPPSMTHAQVQIIDYSGKVLLTQDIKERSQVNLTNLSTGVYLIRWYSASSVGCKQFMVVR